MARRRRITTAAVRSEFPVVALYVVSLVLLSFFVTLFRDGPSEGEIPINLPRDEGSGGPPPVRFGDVPIEFVVTVARGPAGGLGKMTVIGREGLAEAESFEGLDGYRAELWKCMAETTNRPGQLVLVIGGDVLYENYVTLLDIAIQAGFEDVTAYPAGAAKR